MPTCPSALSTRASSRTADAQVRRSEGDVVTHRRHEQLIVRILEDDPHSPADLPQVLLAHLEPTDVNASEAAAEDAIEVQHEGGLAGPVRAEQRHPLAAADGQVDAEQRLTTVGVREGQAADVERRCHRGSTHATTEIASAAAGSMPARNH